ncbi:MAG TPA: FAD/NAD(P)-binding protein [Nocardioides sp.]|uniref:FAD/NAD(P)-binding protein n=1 Tax=Nocardioides sp. TaxID=35761 RepID=UPI002E30DAC0|nr:FAD/NAD(P)-binding protein [Nocardioides sp.]HEX5086255.1 FAD/NAD(P)-binding protein [Nocardioides sp.]
MLQPEVQVTVPPARPLTDTGPVRTDVAVVGGGASGTLTAIHLLASRAHDLTVSVHDASGEIGKGLAYGTSDRRHLLNVRSRHMSAFPDIPSDLVEWARRTGREPDAQAFLPRRDYAVYLRETIDRLADDRLSLRAERVVDAVPTDGGFELRTIGGRVTRAATVVLAQGNERPARLAVEGIPLPEARWHLPDPWDLERLTALPRDAAVVLVGSGLTAVDAAITLLGDAPDRRVVMVSRHGLLPAAHIEQSSTAWLSPVPSGPVTADQLAGLLREQIAAARRQGVDWRAVVDGLRAPTQGLWQRLDLAERQRFLQHYAREWEVRRHRMATEVATALATYRDEGRLQVLAGGVAAVTDHGSRCELELPALPDPMFADAVVNCTGPQSDVARSADPLVRSLVARGLLTPDPLRLGVACTPEGDVLDVSGQVVPGLHVVGPPRKGVLWETTAIPEIRTQAAALAHRLPAQRHVRV